MLSTRASGGNSITTLVLGVCSLFTLSARPAAAQCQVFITGLLGCSPYVDYLGTSTNAEAIAVADLNHDGKLDLVVAVNGEGGGNGAALEVQLGNGDGTFQGPIYLGGCCSPDLRNANWAAIGDFNGDSNLDIAASVGAGGVAIWLGDGTGNFTLKQEISIAGTCCTGPVAGAVGDFRGNGTLDLIVIDNTTNPGQAQVYLGNGDGTFNTTPAVVTLGTMSTNYPDSVVVGDFNQDGLLDFATVNSGCCSDSISVVLGNGNGTFQAAVNYPVANASGNVVNGVSIVTADFNHDGYLDLATLEPGSNAIAVFLNNRNGTFGTPTFYSAQGSVTDPSFPMDLAVGDFNKDGNPDLAFSANWRGGAGVILGNADGTFGQPIWYVTDVAATGVATGDFNGDGNPDLIVSTNANNSATVLLGNGDGSFKSARNYVPFIVTNGFTCSIGNGDPNPSTIAFADFNGDGKPDMAVTDANNCNVAIFLNNGDGTFTETANYNPHVYYSGQPYQVVAADVNNDGKMDLVVSVSDITFSVLLGNGNGTFQSAVTYSNGTGAGSAGPIAVADVNGDGKLDVISNTQNTNANGSFYVNLGNGDGTFQPGVATPVLCPTGGGSGAVWFTVADLNGDGKPDIVGACNGNPQPATISVLLGNGDGTFGTPTQFATGTLPVGIAIGDFNGDGKPDLAVTDYVSTQVSILLGNGDGTFQPPTSFSIFPNGGAGWGSPYYHAYPDSIVVADFNQDGKLDILVGDADAYQAPNGNGSYNIGVQLFLGNGDGTFQPVQNYLAGRQAGFLAVADLNGDGSPDVGVVSATDHSVNVLLNRLGAPVTASTTTTISAPAITYGANGQVTVSVSSSSGTVTGTVTLSEDGGMPLSQTLSGGSAIFTLTAPTGGPHSLSANYAAQGSFGASSASGSLQVNQAQPTVSFTGAPASAAYQSTFMVAATTNASTTATITASGACSIMGNTVTMTAATGTCSLTANWPADNNYLAASANQSTAATKIAPTVTFTGAPASAVYGSTFTIASTTNASTKPSYTGTAGICSVSGTTVTMKSGTGTCTTTASWAADTNYLATTATQTTTAVKANSTVMISASMPNPSVVGQAVAVSVSVAPVTPATTNPTGNVTVSDGRGDTCTASLSSGSGSCNISVSAAGTQTLTATYNGNTNFNTSTSAGVSQTVNMASTTTTITRSPTTSVTGQPVTVKFKVAPVSPGKGTPGGNVTVSDGVGDTCSATVATGSCVITFTTPGSKTLTGSYGGNADFLASTSAGVTETVNQGATKTTITSHSPQPSVAGQSVTFTFSVVAVSPASGTPTGNVTVSDAAGDSCTATVATGSCAITFATSGNKSMTASYGGDPNFASSKSGAVTQPVIDFSIAAPARKSVKAGSQTTLNVTLAPKNSFTATVALSCSAPAGVTCSLSPASVTLSDSTSATSTATVGSSTKGTYTLTFTGVYGSGAPASGGLTHSTTVTLTVD